MDPDPGGPKTCGSGGSGLGFATLMKIRRRGSGTNSSDLDPPLHIANDISTIYMEHREILNRKPKQLREQYKKKNMKIGRPGFEHYLVFLVFPMRHVI
jgi:hypothetical protein